MKKRVLLYILTGFLINVPVGPPLYSTGPTVAYAQHNLLSQDSAPFIDADIAMETAKKMIKKGDYSGALAVLEPYLSQPEKYPEIYSDYIVILTWAGDQGRAISLFESMPSSIPRRSYLLRNMAKSYYDTGSYTKAMALYSNVIELTPEDNTAKQGLILSLMAGGDVEKAMEMLDRMSLETHDDVDFNLMIAESLFQKKLYWDSLKIYHRIIVRSQRDIENIATLRDNLFSSLKKDQRKAVLGQVLAAISSHEEDAAQSYVLVLILFKDYKKAIDTFQEHRLLYADLTFDKAYWVAWAYFKTGDPSSAASIFEWILKQRPGHTRSRIGLAYCMTEMGDSDKAFDQLKILESRDPHNLEILYAIAFVYEKKGRFLDAVETYETILRISPGNPTATRLKLRAYSDMGAAAKASEMAEKEFPLDDELLNSFIADKAVNHIRWGEPEVAKDMLSRLAVTKQNRRYQYDYIIALIRANYQERAIYQYEALINEGGDPPNWVLVEVADAYHYLDKNEEALELYNRVLEVNKDSRRARIGKFNALQGLREWESAQGILDELDDETPRLIGSGRYAKSNPEKEDLAIRRGWFLANQDRLKDADAYLQQLYAQTPGNIEVRDALAHVHLWRGWPRQALNEFNIIRSMDPEYSSSETGRIETLNTLGFKNDARKLADELEKKTPRSKWAQRLVRRLEVEDKPENRLEFSYSVEEDGITDIMLMESLSASINPNTRLYGFLLWRKTWDDDPDESDLAVGDQDPTYYHRTGAGIINTFNSDWALLQQLSIDYDTGEDPGLLTSVRWTPDDYWGFGVMVNTFTTDVAKRAWAEGVTARKYMLEAGYRQSEWWEYNLSVSRQRFSDDNDRDELMIGYEKNLFFYNDWRMRIFLDLYAVQNSEWDNAEVNYFNPKNAWGFSLTHMTERTVWKGYDHHFIHRLYLTGGNFKQWSYSNGLVGSIRYEQEFEFSDTHQLQWGTNIGTNLYDGEHIDNIVFDIIWIKRF